MNLPGSKEYRAHFLFAVGVDRGATSVSDAECNTSMMLHDFVQRRRIVDIERCRLRAGIHNTRPKFLPVGTKYLCTLGFASQIGHVALYALADAVP